MAIVGVVVVAASAAFVWQVVVKAQSQRGHDREPHDVAASDPPPPAAIPTPRPAPPLCDPWQEMDCVLAGVSLPEATRAAVVSSYEKACTAGEASACFFLSQLVGQDQGLSLAERACAAASAPACLKLGRALVQQGTAGDPRRATAFFEKACTGGSIEGCFRQGVLDDTAEGALRKPAAATAHYDYACSRGFLPACFNLALAHELGTGAAKDLPRAAHLYYKACGGGDGVACFNLARLSPHLPEGAPLAATLLARSCALGFSPGCQASAPAPPATSADLISVYLWGDDPAVLRLGAYPDDVQARIGQTIGRWREFHTRQIDTAPLYGDPADAPRSRTIQFQIERVMVAVSEAPDVESQAARYLNGASLMPEWQGFSPGPLREADHAMAYVSAHPESPLAPYLRLFAIHRLKLALTAMDYDDSPEARKAEVRARYGRLAATARQSPDPLIRAIAQDLDVAGYLYSEAEGRTRKASGQPRP
jgi:TPR repeat protein